ncbi:DUF1292 domain-containing protein [Alloiococcus sp. CFN-8]|uniref:DUF1292 domain-containing protein n=1 Tax=Alloiococcus sp. CFN-8 TaxID=3416081 RepID=UPI003CE7D0AE
MNDNEMNKCNCGCGDMEENQGGTCDCGHDHEHHHDHEGCDCGHDHNHESFVVDLEDEEGNIISCEVVDAFEYKDGEYVLVQNPNDGSVYLFKSVGEEGELVVPEDSEFEEVTAYYQQLSSEEE